MSKWQWKEKDGSTGGLLYEPGNWGDILKGEWLLRVLEILFPQGRAALWQGLTQPAREGGAGAGDAGRGDPALYLDPFAGMPEYPVSRACQERIAGLERGLRLPAAVSAYVERGRWPGACALAANYFATRGANACCPSSSSADAVAGAAAAKMRSPLCFVYDRDDARRGLLAADGRFSGLPAQSGWDLVPPAQEYGLVLIDPYDVLAEWQEVLPRVLATAERMPVLLYVYNRAGRGRAHLQEYRKFRSALRAAEIPAMWGRAAADAFLPDCWHEMFFLPPAKVAQAERAALLESLREATVGVEQAIRAAGSFGVL